MPETLHICPIDDDYRDWATKLIKREWGGPAVVSRGRLHDLSRMPGFVAVQQERPVGLVTYHVEEYSCEITSLNSLVAGLGVGTALIGAVKEEARGAGCRRLWLITTNDNTSALRFYQRRGFVLSALHRDAIKDSRRLKPQIPALGQDGIPIRDEIELEMHLQSRPHGGGSG